MSSCNGRGAGVLIESRVELSISNPGDLVCGFLPLPQHLPYYKMQDKDIGLTSLKKGSHVKDFS